MRRSWAIVLVNPDRLQAMDLDRRQTALTHRSVVDLKLSTLQQMIFWPSFLGLLAHGI